MRQLIHSTSGDNNLAPFDMWCTETILKHKKGLKYYLRDCLENFLLLPLSLRIHENSNNVLILQEKHQIFNKYYTAPTELAFNAKVVVQYEVRNKAF